MPQDILSSDFLLPIILADYNFREPVQCRFIRRGVNDHYHVKSGDQEYFLRIYLNGKYYISTADDFRFELSLLDFLSRNGLPVAPPIQKNNGQFLGTIEIQKDVHYFALFQAAQGQVFDDYPDRRNPNLGTQLGEITAKLHLKADEFVTQYPRYHLNLHFLIDEPLRIFEKHLKKNGMDDLSSFRPFAEKMKNTISRLKKEKSIYGIIHADLHRWNLHYDENAGFRIYDFDHCAYGWRVYDLCAVGQALSASFLKGYESVRPLSSEEKECIPIFTKVREIWDIGDYLAMRPVRGRKEPDKAYLEEELERLQKLI